MTSIKDVALKAGVSMSTASIVVNGKAKERKISDLTQKRVLQAIQDLNYIPNVSAKSLRKGEAQKFIVALFCSFDYRSGMMLRLLHGIQEKINKSHVAMSIIIHPYVPGKLCDEKESIESGEFHAAIMANSNGDDLDFLKSNKFIIPIILYNRVLEEYSSVNLDDDVIGQEVAKHLHDEEYNKPLIIHGTGNFPGTNKREKAFMEKMSEYGIKMDKKDILYTETSPKGGVSCSDEVLKKIQSGQKDCAFCASDAIAIGLVNELRRRRVNIPEDFGVISIGNIDPCYAACNYPDITVMELPIGKMGAGCYDFLMDRIQNYSGEPKKRYYKAQLHIRTSTKRKHN